MSETQKRGLEVLCAIGATAVVASYFLVFKSGESLHYALYYNTPIAAPFAVFMVQMLYRRDSREGLFVDASVVGLALARASLPMPGYSGHVLFLMYALLSRSGWVRVLAALVLAEVLFIKLVLWSDWLTPLGALTLAVIAVRLRRPYVLPSNHPSAGPYRTTGPSSVSTDASATICEVE